MAARGSSRGERAADDQPLDVARTLVDLAAAQVEIDALDGEVGDVTVAAVNLDRSRAHALGHLGGEELGHRCFLEARLSRIAQARRVPDHLSRDLDLGCHVGESEGDRLMLDERLTEGLPLARVPECRIERGSRHAHTLRSDADAAGLEVGERDPVAFALATKQICGGNTTTLLYDLCGVGYAVPAILFVARLHAAGPLGV